MPSNRKRPVLPGVAGLVFTLKNARFNNSQNRSADLRLVVEAPEFAAGLVKLSR